MKSLGRFGWTAALVLGAAITSSFAGDVTVGRFYTQIARAKQLGSADPTSAESSLRGAGYRLPDLALDKTLTEGDVASISQALGLTVTTQRPSAPVNEAQAAAFVSSFGTQLGAKGSANEINGDGTGGVDPGNSGNGKGKKKGHNKSTPEPL